MHLCVGLAKRKWEKTTALIKFHFKCICRILYIHVKKTLSYKSKYKLYQFVCSAIFCEYITQRRECKSAVNGKTIQADLSHLRMQIGRTFSEVLHSEHHQKACQEWSSGYCDSWLTCRKIHKQTGPGCAVNRWNLLPKVGTQSFESHFSALSIHSQLAELNYIRSNLVSHLFSSAGQEPYLHEVAIEAYCSVQTHENKGEEFRHGSIAINWIMAWIYCCRPAFF